MTWDVEYSDEFGWWYERQLTEVQQEGVDRAVEALIEHGPALGRPVVGEVLGSRIPHLKELRVGTIRVLFAFDPRRTAYLILGGNKAGEWNEWYPGAISEAERLWDEYLAELRQEGVLPG
jgi:hypothetical protein